MDVLCVAGGKLGREFVPAAVDVLRCVVCEYAEGFSVAANALEVKCAEADPALCEAGDDGTWLGSFAHHFAPVIQGERQRSRTWDVDGIEVF